jgi:tetratricopeptide (TPR) repeat protein
MRTRPVCLALLCCLLTAPALLAADTNSEGEKINVLLAEAQSLQGRKRYIDAFAKLDEAEKLDPKRAEIYNIRGAIHLAQQVRDVKLAREQFEKARDLQPDAMPPYFNLAEVEFVRRDWPGVEVAFKDLLKRFPKLQQGIHHLVLFKVFIATVKQDKVADAEKFLAEHYTFMDDTPAYYFAKAVLAKHAKRDQEGNDWLTKGQLIFKGDASHAYVDSLMEAGFIDTLQAPAGADSPQ